MYEKFNIQKLKKVGSRSTIEYPARVSYVSPTEKFAYRQSTSALIPNLIRVRCGKKESCEKVSFLASYRYLLPDVPIGHSIIVGVEDTP